MTMVRKGNLAVFDRYFVNMHVHVHLHLLYFLLFSFPPLSSVILPSPPPLRLGYTVLLQTQEGEECPQVKSLLNDRLDYYPINFLTTMDCVVRKGKTEGKQKVLYSISGILINLDLAGATQSG